MSMTLHTTAVYKALMRARVRIANGGEADEVMNETLADYLARECDQYTLFEACVFQVGRKMGNILFPHEEGQVRAVAIDALDQTIDEIARRRELLDEADYDTAIKTRREKEKAVCDGD